MCEGLKLLGENHEAIEPKAFSERANAWVSELAELARAKTGREVKTHSEADGTIALELAEGKALGVLPWWCTRSVDRCDPLRLALRFTTTDRADGLLNFKASVYERPAP